MKRSDQLCVLGVVAILVAGCASETIAPSLKVAGKTDTYLLAGAQADNGTCGLWADDTYNLQITVTDNGDGTFAVHTDYKAASFVTRAGASPGGCQSEVPHGSLVAGGIKGQFTAWVDETITSATYNPDACKTRGGGPGGQLATCSGRGAFILAVFGCDEGVCADGNTFSWNFEYRSNDKRLTYNYWRDAWPALAPNEFQGDIATQ